MDAKLFSALSKRVDENGFADEQRRVVLVPRCWDQAPGDEPGVTVAKVQGTPGRARYKP